MVAIRRTLDRAAWEARARHLAVEHHLDGTARGPWVYEDEPDGDARYYVPSQSEIGTAHLVLETVHGLRCDCAAGLYGRPCGHIGAVLVAIEQRERAMAARDAAEWQRGFDIYEW